MENLFDDFYIFQAHQKPKMCDILKIPKITKNNIDVVFEKMKMFVDSRSKKTWECFRPCYRLNSICIHKPNALSGLSSLRFDIGGLYECFLIHLYDKKEHVFYFENILEFHQKYVILKKKI